MKSGFEPGLSCFESQVSESPVLGTEEPTVNRTDAVHGPSSTGAVTSEIAFPMTPYVTYKICSSVSAVLYWRRKCSENRGYQQKDGNGLHLRSLCCFQHGLPEIPSFVEAQFCLFLRTECVWTGWETCISYAEFLGHQREPNYQIPHWVTTEPSTASLRQYWCGN